ncbi:hypothetical protein OIO90_004183 [Microbotryomycetes sp. JL221]|nr:hypothetical protein OIO90_004183 [Microbotryomycetes sp. JL221]
MTKPDPTDPSSFNHTFVQVKHSGHRYHVVDQGPSRDSFVGKRQDAPTLLLCHGFPDSWYGWRYQIHEFASRGWRVIVPSQLGYGYSDSPIDVAAYSYKSVAYDMNGLLDELGVPGQVVVVGHDCVCTPYQPPTQPGIKPISDEQLVRKFMPQFGYQLYFASDQAPQELEQALEFFLQPMHSPHFRRGYVPKEREMGGWVKEGRLRQSILKQLEDKKNGKVDVPGPEKEFDVYLSEYRHSGLRGALSWYKTRSINFKEEQESGIGPNFPAHIPALQLPAEKDAALPPSMAMAPSVLKCFPGGNLEIKVLQNADHWCLQDERVRDKVTSLLAEWIERVLAGKWRPEGTSKL